MVHRNKMKCFSKNCGSLSMETGRGILVILLIKMIYASCHYRQTQGLYIINVYVLLMQCSIMTPTAHPVIPPSGICGL